MVDLPATEASHAYPAKDDFYRELVSRNLGVYSEAEQERLQHSRVFVIGLGGVGGYEVVLCARMGIGHVSGADPDTFEISNINRQMLAMSSTVGRSKAATAEAVVTDINPYLSTRFASTALDESNAADLIEGHDLVLEAVDDMPSRVIIHRTARDLGIPSVGMSGSPPNRGFVATFFPDGPAYETVLNLPGLGEKLADSHLRQRIADVKQARARYSVTRGAPAAWADAYCSGQAEWIITPVRAHLLALFSVHEAFAVLTGREPLARAPKGILIDLDSATPIRVAAAPDGGWDYATL